LTAGRWSLASASLPLSLVALVDSSLAALVAPRSYSPQLSSTTSSRSPGPHRACCRPCQIRRRTPLSARLRRRGRFPAFSSARRSIRLGGARGLRNAIGQLHALQMATMACLLDLVAGFSGRGGGRG